MNDEQVLPIRTHELKIWPRFFDDVLNRTKTYEVRVNDRAYQVGDAITLREWDPDLKTYSGRFCLVRITHLTDSSVWYMVPNHLAIFGIELLS